MIDAELAKYETWDAFYAAKNSIVNILDNERSFLRTKEQGAGRNIICAFLGNNWNRTGPRMGARKTGTVRTVGQRESL
jgi:hypothetical protein